MDLDPLRDEIESFLRQLAEEEYLQQGGLKPESDLAAIYGRHKHLLNATHREEVRAALAEDGASNGLRLLLEFLTRTSLEAEVQEVADRFLSEEASACISVEERTIPLRGADAAIRDEADRGQRSRLERAWAQGIGRLNPLLRERMTRLQEAEIGRASCRERV